MVRIDWQLPRTLARIRESGNLIIAPFNIPREESLLLPLSKTMTSTLDSFGQAGNVHRQPNAEPAVNRTFVLEILDTVSRTIVAWVDPALVHLSCHMRLVPFLQM